MPNQICERARKRILSRKQAMRQAAWYRRERFARMGHYRCRSCGGWHIGNNHRKPHRRR